MQRRITRNNSMSLASVPGEEPDPRIAGTSDDGGGPISCSYSSLILVAAVIVYPVGDGILMSFKRMDQPTAPGTPYGCAVSQVIFSMTKSSPHRRQKTR